MHVYMSSQNSTFELKVVYLLVLETRLNIHIIEQEKIKYKNKVDAVR